MISFKKLEEIKEYCRNAHESINQKRKYSGEPYYYHTQDVSNILTLFVRDFDIIAASAAHDLVEDVTPLSPTTYSYDNIKEFLGEEIFKIVLEVTNVYTKERYPELNRKIRQELEKERLLKASWAAKMIKLADVFSNFRDFDLMWEKDKGFAIKYFKEKWSFIIDLGNCDVIISENELFQLVKDRFLEINDKYKII